jgi:3-phytase
MNFTKYIALTLTLGLFSACNLSPEKKQAENTNESVLDSLGTTEPNKEAREDSMKMAEALTLQAKFTNIIEADYETTPVLSELGEDAADDPAIWINKTNPEKSIIIGTNKKAGLNVYDLQGNELQFAPVGNINNVDISYDFVFNRRTIDLVAASNRSTQTVDVWEIDGENQKMIEKQLIKIPSGVDDVYGLCMYHNKNTNQHYVFVNGKNGKVEQWLLQNESDTLTAMLARSFWVNSQPEGMVVDPITDKLYVGVEEDAIYQFNALPNDTLSVKLEQSSATNKDISYDIEGLTIYRKSDKEGYLIASSQGSFSYAIFDINEPYNYITSFVVKNGKYDGVEETDGIDICSTPMGDEFPAGILVLQDGFNKDGETIVNQNFKIISAKKILDFLK